jgi:hypothetical protein
MEAPDDVALEGLIKPLAQRTSSVGSRAGRISKRRGPLGPMPGRRSPGFCGLGLSSAASFCIPQETAPDIQAENKGDERKVQQK